MGTNKSWEIKRCPFCGGDATIWQRYSLEHNVFFCYVKCDMCGAEGKTASSGSDEPAKCGWDNDACRRAIKAWNTRVRDGAEY